MLFHTLLNLGSFWFASTEASFQLAQFRILVTHSLFLFRCFVPGLLIFSPPSFWRWTDFLIHMLNFLAVAIFFVESQSVWHTSFHFFPHFSLFLCHINVSYVWFSRCHSYFRRIRTLKCWYTYLRPYAVYNDCFVFTSCMLSVRHCR